MINQSEIARQLIATELMRGCPEESLDDHETIADAIRNGMSIGELVSIPEMLRYPETYRWVVSQIESLEITAI
jgi:hypothetical protein